MRRKYYSYQAKDNEYSDGGIINFRTDDNDIYEHVKHYIETLMDADSYRRPLKPITPTPRSYETRNDGRSVDGGIINFRTDDKDIYEHVQHYITALIDAENYRRTFQPITWVDGTRDGRYRVKDE